MVASCASLTHCMSLRAWQASICTILTYCCVIDDPPWVSSLVLLRISARRVPLKSSAPCS